MSSLRAVELVGLLACFGLLSGRVRVWVGELGGFTEGRYDASLNPGLFDCPCQEGIFILPERVIRMEYLTSMGITPNATMAA